MFKIKSTADSASCHDPPYDGYIINKNCVWSAGFIMKFK